MKKLHKFLMLAALVLGVTTVVAQSKKFKEGYIGYKMTMSKSDSLRGEMTIEGMMDFTVKDDKLRTGMTMNMMGMPVSLENFLNKDSETGVVLVKFMNQKIGAKIMPDDYRNLGMKKGMLEIQDIKLTNETKTILGYACKKALVTTKDGHQGAIYYTEAFKPLDAPGTSEIAGLQELKGLPLLIQINGDDASFTMEVTDINTKTVADTAFSFEIPQGYQEITYDELSELSGGNM